VSSTDDDHSSHPIDVHLFPNPVEDVLLITIGEYVPADAYVEFYSTLGQQTQYRPIELAIGRIYVAHRRSRQGDQIRKSNENVVRDDG
jgi:hypothetical protein